MAYVTQNFYSGQKLTDEHMKHIEAGISTADANATKALDIAQKDHATLPPEIAGKADNWMIEEETGLAYLTSGGKKISSGIMIPNDGSGVGGSGSAGTPYAVQYVFQKLTDEQKAQARKNIGVGDGGLCYVLELSADEADAQKNTDAITAAISEHKYVALKTGNYPVKPGIVIESGKLDMNGSRFYTVDYKSETPLVYLRGESPEICNGELEGSYDLADNEAGYSFFEKESLICPEGVNDAYIHHLDLHNNWGYCISPGENVERVYIDKGTIPQGSNDKKYITDHIAIPEGYKYVTAAGSIGYNYIISVSPVEYVFYDANGTKILIVFGVPRKRVLIPNGAATVTFTTHTNTDAIIPYRAYFTNYTETLVVSDCKFHHFHSLGMANMPGPTTVARCSFISCGKPRDGVKGTSRSTTGGIDIEDVQTPEFIMSDCYSYDCMKLLMFGGYKGVVTNCIGNPVGVYRGWQFDISNCNVDEFYTMGTPGCRISTNGVHANLVSIKAENRKDVRGDISTNYLSRGNTRTYLACFDRFFVRIADITNDQHGEVSGRLNGRIEAVGSSGLKMKNFSSEPGSHVDIDITMIPAQNGNYSGALKATGDIHGLVSNVPFFPNGFTIHDSTFNIGSPMTAYGWEDVTYSGGFKDCVFNLTGAPYFRLFARSPADAVEIQFDGCTINNADNKLFNFVPAAGSRVTFKNCTIANEGNLFNGDTSRITINILTGDEIVVASSTEGSTKKFKITVDDSGAITATEFV